MPLTLQHPTTGEPVALGDVYACQDEEGSVYPRVLVWLPQEGRYAFVPTEDFTAALQLTPPPRKTDWLNISQWFGPDVRFQGNVLTALNFKP
jgi:hypothetical protein